MALDVLTTGTLTLAASATAVVRLRLPPRAKVTEIRVETDGASEFTLSGHHIWGQVSDQKLGFELVSISSGSQAAGTVVDGNLVLSSQFGIAHLHGPMTWQIANASAAQARIQFWVTFIEEFDD